MFSHEIFLFASLLDETWVKIAHTLSYRIVWNLKLHTRYRRVDLASVSIFQNRAVITIGTLIKVGETAGTSIETKNV